MQNEPATRKLKISILRFNPQERESVPRMVTYELEEAEGMTLFMALNEIREKQEPSLQFDFVCRAGICGSCSMIINGRPALACRTLTKDLAPEISLAPLPVFELIADLSVDTGKWMRGMSERLEAWLHMKEQETDLGQLEERMEPELAEKIYELDRCIECGCCIAGCGTVRCVKTSSARWGSIKSPASVSTLVTAAQMRTISSSSAMTMASSAAYRCLAATTCVRRTCHWRHRSHFSGAKWS
jgi:succinate dehydrogenase/fumarate reductase iron-sulfur protein